MIEALRYKPEGRGFVSLEFFIPSSPGVNSASNRNEYQEFYVYVTVHLNKSNLYDIPMLSVK